MKLEAYTMPMAGKGWKPPAVRPRIQADGTYGGVVVHSSPGHIGDEMWRVPLPPLKGKPKISTVRTYTAETHDHALTANEALAFYVNLAASAFAAISVATMRLKRSAAGAGTLSVEVWEKNASSLPERKIGLLGAIDVASGLSTSYQDVTVWSNRHAWPFFGPNGGYLVLNGKAVSAGTVYWAGENVAADAHAEYIAYAGMSKGGVAPSTDMSASGDTKLKIQVDAEASPTEVTFAWAGCTTGPLVAAEMQTKIRALGGAYAAVTVVYVPDAGVSDYYLVTSGTVGITSKVVIMDGATLNCADDLKLGIANGGTETLGGWKWQTADGELSATVWQGGDFLVLRGFQEAYCYPGGDGPQAWTLELDDGSQYSVKLREVEGQWGLEPLDVDREGILVDAAAIFQPISEVGQQGLGTT